MRRAIELDGDALLAPWRQLVARRIVTPLMVAVFVGSEQAAPVALGGVASTGEKKDVMKFLAMNVGKTIRVWPDEYFDGNYDESFTMIGGDGENSVPMDSYLHDFPG